jgi:glycerate-2-kinase
VGEAREVGRALSAVGNAIIQTSTPIPPPALVIAGGETTVTVKGKGKGGRNCELVLSSLQDLKEGVTMLSFGTDGIDGSADAGGALGDYRMWRDDAPAFLEDNDSASYLEREGGLIMTGPTGTNVGDIVLVMASRKR